MAGPGQSNAFSWQRLDRRPPFCDVRIIGVQIGDFGRDRRLLGLKCQGQAAERTIDVIGGQSLAARMT